jgi:hypothetical protein
LPGTTLKVKLSAPLAFEILLVVIGLKVKGAEVKEVYKLILFETSVGVIVAYCVVDYPGGT